MVKAVYPGSFDPVTNGHLDLIRRGSRLFEELTVAVLHNGAKSPLFSVEERVAMLSEVTGELGNVRVRHFSGLLADFADEEESGVILRGLRTYSDYEIESQMAVLNRQLRPGLETVFLVASPVNAAISSRFVKEIASHGGDVSALVPALVLPRLQAKLATR